MSRSYHHGALAEAMVEQALIAVREHGADDVSLRAMAQALDVSPSAAYNHFADKDDLLRAVGACGLAALDERMSRVLAAHLRRRRTSYYTPIAHNGWRSRPRATTPRIVCGKRPATARASASLPNSANTHAPEPLIRAAPYCRSHARCFATSG